MLADGTGESPLPGERGRDERRTAAADMPLRGREPEAWDLRRYDLLHALANARVAVSEGVASVLERRLDVRRLEIADPSRL